MSEVKGYVVRWNDESGETPERTSEVSLSDAVALWSEQDPASEPRISAIFADGSEMMLPNYEQAIVVFMAAARWRDADLPFRSLAPHDFEVIEHTAHAVYDASRLDLLCAVKSALVTHGPAVDCIRQECLHEPADSACILRHDVKR